jgi:uncharacterized membrane protein (UPF0136 family)
MNSYPALLPFAQIYFPIVGVVMIAGGFVGFLKAKSVASLIAGSVSGLLLIIGACLFGVQLQVGLVVVLLVCLALLGRFLPALFRGKMMPAAYVAPLSLIGAVLSLWLLLQDGGMTARQRLDRDSAQLAK